jgi:hypothetical protein
VILFLKIFIFCFVFTACVQEKQGELNTSSTSAFSEKLPNTKWSSRTSFPLTIHYGADFSPSEISALENSANNWSDSVNNEVDFFDISSSQVVSKENINNYEDKELGIYKVSVWPKELPPTALAVTQIFGLKLNAGKSSEYIQIQHADILINEENFSFTTDDSWGYDLETIILHEMGHFLGLYHDDTSSELSIMYPTISRYVDNRHPKEKDITNILNKYSNQGAISESHQALANLAQEQEGELVTLIMELYPNGKEIIKIKKGDKYETLNTNCLNH